MRLHASLDAFPKLVDQPTAEDAVYRFADEPLEKRAAWEAAAAAAPRPISRSQCQPRISNQRYPIATGS
jgi:hypothetical protein